MATTTSLKDPEASFNKAIALARATFTAIQDKALVDLSKATAEAREARRERDEAAKALQALRTEGKAWKEDVGSWKTRAEQAEITINKQAEIIVQLRNEAAQWKQKEQIFRRVMAGEELNYDHASTPSFPMTPNLRDTNSSISSRQHYPPTHPPTTPASQDMPSSSAKPHSNAPKSAKSVSRNEKPLTVARNRATGNPVVQLPTPASEHLRNVKQIITKGKSSPIHSPSVVERSNVSSEPSISHTRLLRRVRAVVEIPVKEESSDIGLPGPSSSTHTTTSAPAWSALTSHLPQHTPVSQKNKRAFGAMQDGDDVSESDSEQDSDGYQESQSVAERSDEDELTICAKDNNTGMQNAAVSKTARRTNPRIVGPKRRKLRSSG